MSDNKSTEEMSMAKILMRASQMNIPDPETSDLRDLLIQAIQKLLPAPTAEAAQPQDAPKHKCSRCQGGGEDAPGIRCSSCGGSGISSPAQEAVEMSIRPVPLEFHTVVQGPWRGPVKFYHAAEMDKFIDTLLTRARKAEGDLGAATAAHGKTLLLLHRAAFETIPALEARIAELEAQVDGWVSVERADDLPPIGQNVIVCNALGQRATGYRQDASDVEQLCGGTFVGDWLTTIMRPVTHWRPLPSPPAQEEEQKP